MRHRTSRVHFECILKTESGDLFIGRPMDYPDQLDDCMPAEVPRTGLNSLLETLKYRTALGGPYQYDIVNFRLAGGRA